jgi:hypothetical protein
MSDATQAQTRDVPVDLQKPVDKRLPPVDVVEEPSVTINATDHAEARALLNLMEGRLELFEANLLTDFKVSLDKVKASIGQDINRLRTLFHLDGAA